MNLTLPKHFEWNNVNGNGNGNEIRKCTRLSGNIWNCIYEIRARLVFCQDHAIENVTGCSLFLARESQPTVWVSMYAWWAEANVKGKKGEMKLIQLGQLVFNVVDCLLVYHIRVRPNSAHWWFNQPIEEKITYSKNDLSFFYL